MTRRKWFGLILVTILSLLLIPSLIAADPLPHSPTLQKIPLALRVKIEPQVLKELASGEKTTYIVHLTQQADLTPAQRIQGKLTRRQAVVSSLQAMAERSQRSIRAYLNGQQASGHVEEYIPFWVFNGLAVTGDLETLLSLAARPEVDAIRANHTHQLPNPKPKIQPPTSNLQSVEWNIAQVRADQVWSDFGITGRGVVVANMDTGVDWTHPALQGQYRGADGHHDYNWFDFTNTYPAAPDDGHDHGTHTMGTIVGDDGSENQIGVAPGARWIAVKVFDDSGNTDDVKLHQGFQWILAPTDLNGENPDPSQAPDVVGNSWGSFNGADPTFWHDAAAWRTAAIFPVFAAGNDGDFGNGSTDSPGSFPHAVAVGATNSDDDIASFSGRGPSFWEETKPEVSAPGVDIRSSIPGGGYEGGWNGTSMATPHVVGLTALLLEADHTLTADDLENFMKYTALDLGEPGPDNTFGAGRIDAHDAVRWALGAGKLYGQVSVSSPPSVLPSVPPKVRGEVPTSNFQPPTSNFQLPTIPGATISGVSQTGDQFTTTTDATGTYTVSVPGGLYDVTASAFGYLSATVESVEVITGYMSMRDLLLKPAPHGTLSGRVTEGGTGEPLEATILVLDTPAWTTADAAFGNGFYSLTLPVGSHTVEASTTGHQIQRATVSIAEDAATSQDFTLPLAPSLLLVDADAWMGDNVTLYYQHALDEAGYLYETRLITDTDYIPTAEELGAYDVVLWANTWRSPGYIGADETLMDYLDGGGRLLIAGQDVGYWDDYQSYAPLFYTNYLHANFLGEPQTIDPLVGADILQGLTLIVNDTYAYKNTGFCSFFSCFYPDEIEPADDAAWPIMAHPNGDTFGVKAEASAYRAIYFGFGLESVGPRDELAQTMGRAITWLTLPSLTKTVDREETTPGQALTYTLTLSNIGSADLPGVGLTDPIPEHTTYVPDSATGGATYDPVLDRVQWSGTLPAMIQMTFTFQVVVEEPVASGTIITNTATLDDGQGHAIQASVATTVLGPDLTSSTKTVDKIMALAGDTLTYTIALKNTGSFSATGVSLVDPIPENTVYLPDSVTGGAVYNATLDQIEWAGDVPADSPEEGSYTWIDSDTPGGPIYDWLDITGTGAPITGLGDDSNVGPFPIGFSFPFYGNEFDQFYFCTNGFLSLSPISGRNFSNLALPDPSAPGNLLAPFWDDLNFTPGGAAYYWSNDQDTLVVSYLEVYHYGDGGPYTFQVILRADGSITYQYQSMVERLEEATIGVQNADGAQGLTIAHNQAYVHDELAVLISPPLPPVPLPTITFQVEIEDPLPANTVITNTAFITEETELGRQRTATTIVNSVDLTGSAKTVDPIVVASGDVLTYTVVLRNTGGGDAQVNVTDPLPEHTTYTPESATGGAIYNSALARIEWTGTVSALAESTFSFQVSLESPLSDGLMITNTATIDDGLHPPFTRTAASMVQSSDLGDSVKTVDKATAPAGDTLTYTIALKNTGSITASDASLMDPIPENTVYVSGSVTGGAIYNPALNQIEWSGAVPVERDYAWTDSDQPGGPTYAWMDITDTGTSITDLADDTNVGPYPIGFLFPFYGDNFTTFRLCSNGFLSLTSPAATYTNVPLPSGEEPFNLIAPFWDDLTLSTSGEVYYWSNNQDILVVSYVEAPHLGSGGPYTFQVILRADGSITYQYQAMIARLEEATIGIQNADGTQGLTIAHNEPYVHDELAVLISPPTRPQVIAFQVEIADPLPTETIITNTALIDDGQGTTYERRATTRVNTIELENSTKEVDKGVAVPGEVLTYTVTLRNAGMTDAAGVTVVDPIPTHAVYQPDSATGGATYDEAANRILWSGAVPSGDQTSFSFAVRTAAPLPDGAVVANTATINDGVHAPFTRTATTTILAPDLSPSEKQVSSVAVSPGQVLVYTILVKNGGSGPATVALTDTLPAEVVYVPGSAWAGSGGPVVYDTSTHRLTWSGRVPVKAMATVRFTVRGTGQSPITNSVLLDDGAGNVVEKYVTTGGGEHRLFLPLTTRAY